MNVNTYVENILNILGFRIHRCRNAINCLSSSFALLRVLNLYIVILEKNKR